MLKKTLTISLIIAAGLLAFFYIRPHLVDLSETGQNAPVDFSELPPTTSPARIEDLEQELAEPDMPLIPTSTPSETAVKKNEAVQDAVATTTAPKPQKTEPEKILLPVPFTPQAPFGNWDDPRQQDGCEEAAALMAYYWAAGKDLSREKALAEIQAISDFEQKEYGGYHDTSVADTIERIFKGYFQYDKADAEYDISKADIVAELEDGNLVIVPTNGQLLGNPFYTPPGPERHNLVLRGYDPEKDEFITNDPGTKRGEKYHYKATIVIDAIVDYPTGNHAPLETKRKAMIVVSK